MIAKKYEFTGETKEWYGITLHRIRSLVEIAAIGVGIGQLGGWIQKESNLSQIYDNAWISGDARIYGNAQISGDAWIYGNAWISGDARIYGDAWISGNAWISGRKSIGWFSCVGSENGTLTWYFDKDKNILVNRGCFAGTLDDFATAVEKTHGDNLHGQQYRLLIEFIKLRATEALKAE